MLDIGAVPGKDEAGLGVGIIMSIHDMSNFGFMYILPALVAGILIGI